MIDAGLEFYKVKKLLSKNPRMLKDDPVLSIDYYKIINLIKRKKLVENTSDPFSAEDQPVSTWNDLNLVEKANRDKERALMERYRRASQVEAEASGGSDYSEKMNLSTTIEETEANVK